MPESCADVASKITAVVERRWGDATVLEPRDLNEVFLFLAYARAHGP